MNILIYWLEVNTKGLKKNEIEDIKSTLGFESEICTDKDELCENEFLCLLKHEYGYNMLCDVDPFWLRKMKLTILTSGEAIKSNILMKRKKQIMSFTKNMFLTLWIRAQLSKRRFLMFSAQKKLR